jgi:GT2 family glycosyltransferase
LRALLGSLAPQLRPGDHQLIVAENGSTAPSPLPPLPIIPIHIYDPIPGKCRVQNQAIEIATSPTIAFLDDDLIVTPRYLEGVERFFDEHPQFAAMKGRILPALDPVVVAGERAPYLDLPLVDYGDKVAEVHGMIGANMAIRANLFRRLGSFDERLGPGAAGHEEETEMSARIRRAAERIGYCPTAAVIHEVDPARADRTRFLNVARERGYCRTIHERHSMIQVSINLLIARARLAIARLAGAASARIAREEKRLSIARGMMEGVRHKAYLTVSPDKAGAASSNCNSRRP